MFRFQKLVAMITPDFYFVKRFFMGPFAARVQRVQKVQRVQRVVVAAPPQFYNRRRRHILAPKGAHFASGTVSRLKGRPL